MTDQHTLHDQIVALLGSTVELLEQSGTALPGGKIAKPAIKLIRKQQGYDAEVLALLDRLEVLVETTGED